jgi:hypothetical protein
MNKLLLFSAAALLSAGPSLACSCIDSGPAKHFKHSQRVFRGKCTKVKESDGIAAKDLNIVDFDVIKVWKGSRETHTTVITPSSDAACGVKFQVGSEYIVYSSAAGGVRFCEGTKQKP